MSESTDDESVIPTRPPPPPDRQQSPEEPTDPPGEQPLERPSKPPHAPSQRDQGRHRVARRPTPPTGTVVVIDKARGRTGAPQRGPAVGIGSLVILG